MMKLHSNNKLRLLFISSDKFPPFRVDVSTLFAGKIVQRGHRIDWLLQSKDTLRSAYQTEWSGCKVWVGPTNNGTSIISRLMKHFYSFFHDFSMFRILRKNMYDFVLVKDKFVSALVAIAASKIFATKFIYWLSYPFPEYYLYRFEDGTARYPILYWVRGNVFKYLLYRIILPLSDHVLVQSEQMQKDIAGHGIPKEAMTPVPMGVSDTEIPFYGYKSGQNRRAKEKRVLYLGTLTRERKMDFTIRAFEKVLKRHADAKLLIVGGGDEPSEERILMNEAKRIGIETAVTITGFLPQQEAWQYVKDADVCVSPIYPAPILNCGSPTKLIEYMAMGKAVVANDHPEQKVVIAESNGGICVPYDEDAFADAILYLLDHPEEAEEMGKRGREYVEKHRSYEHIADLVETKLLEVSERSGSQRKDY